MPKLLTLKRGTVNMWEMSTALLMKRAGDSLSAFPNIQKSEFARLTFRLRNTLRAYLCNGYDMRHGVFIMRCKVPSWKLVTMWRWHCSWARTSSVFFSPVKEGYSRKLMGTTKLVTIFGIRSSTSKLWNTSFQLIGDPAMGYRRAIELGMIYELV